MLNPVVDDNIQNGTAPEQVENLRISNVNRPKHPSHDMPALRAVQDAAEGLSRLRQNSLVLPELASQAPGLSGEYQGDDEQQLGTRFNKDSSSTGNLTVRCTMTDFDTRSGIGSKCYDRKATARRERAAIFKRAFAKATEDRKDNAN